MSRPSTRRSGVMMLTVWSDHPGPEGARARLRLTRDSTRGDHEELVVAGLDAIVAEVTAFLAEWGREADPADIRGT